MENRNGLLKHTVVIGHMNPENRLTLLLTAAAASAPSFSTSTCRDTRAVPTGDGVAVKLKVFKIVFWLKEILCLYIKGFKQPSRHIALIVSLKDI